MKSTAETHESGPERPRSVGDSGFILPFPLMRKPRRRSLKDTVLRWLFPAGLLGV